MDRVVERLIEAAKAAEQNPSFRIEVMEGGIRLVYIWQVASGQYYTTENFTPWQAIRNASANPLIAGLTSLTKQAGELG